MTAIHYHSQAVNIRVPFPLSILPFNDLVSSPIPKSSCQLQVGVLVDLGEIFPY